MKTVNSTQSCSRNLTTNLINTWSKRLKPILIFITSHVNVNHAHIYLYFNHVNLFLHFLFAQNFLLLTQNPLSHLVTIMSSSNTTRNKQQKLKRAQETPQEKSKQSCWICSLKNTITRNRSGLYDYYSIEMKYVQWKIIDSIIYAMYTSENLEQYWEVGSEVISMNIALIHFSLFTNTLKLRNKVKAHFILINYFLIQSA
jgi:hypothetical protein